MKREQKEEATLQLDADLPPSLKNLSKVVFITGVILKAEIFEFLLFARKQPVLFKDFVDSLAPDQRTSLSKLHQWSWSLLEGRGTLPGVKKFSCDIEFLTRVLISRVPQKASSIPDAINKLIREEVLKHALKPELYNEFVKNLKEKAETGQDFKPSSYATYVIKLLIEVPQVTEKLSQPSVLLDLEDLTKHYHSGVWKRKLKKAGAPTSSSQPAPTPPSSPRLGVTLTLAGA